MAVRSSDPDASRLGGGGGGGRESLKHNIHDCVLYVYMYI